MLNICSMVLLSFAFSSLEYSLATLVSCSLVRPSRLKVVSAFRKIEFLKLHPVVIHERKLKMIVLFFAQNIAVGKVHMIDATPMKLMCKANQILDQTIFARRR